MGQVKHVDVDDDVDDDDDDDDTGYELFLPHK